MEEANTSNFKSFSFVWLEPANTNKAATTILDAQVQCRALVGELKIFENVDDCKQYIQSKCTKSKVILIINQHVSQLSMTHIHDLPQVSAIYVYAMDTEENTEWKKSYSKVKTTSTGHFILSLSKSSLPKLTIILFLIGDTFQI
jgi:hypothetical protein